MDDHNKHCDKPDNKGRQEYILWDVVQEQNKVAELYNQPLHEIRNHRDDRNWVPKTRSGKSVILQ
jgi:hypothetical protein